MKKFILYVFISFMLTTNLYALTDAEYFLRNISNIKSIKANFIQVNEIVDFGEDIYEGSLTIVSKKYALWDYINPEDTWYLFSEDKLEYYDSLNSQLVVYKDFSISENVLLQMLMDLSIINSKFKTVVVGDKITLHPIGDIGAKYIEIFIKGSYIESIISYDFDDNKVEIKFSEMVYNGNIDETIFKKTVPDNTSVFEY